MRACVRACVCVWVRACVRVHVDACLCLCVFVYCLGIVTVLIFNVQVGQFALMDGVQMVHDGWRNLEYVL